VILGLNVLLACAVESVSVFSHLPSYPGYLSNFVYIRLIYFTYSILCYFLILFSYLRFKYGLV